MSRVSAGVKEEDLPRVVVFVAGDDQGGAGAGGGAGQRTFNYEGPTDFDRISTFLGDLAKGGRSVLEIRKMADDQEREFERLRQNWNACARRSR